MRVNTISAWPSPIRPKFQCQLVCSSTHNKATYPRECLDILKVVRIWPTLAAGRGCTVESQVRAVNSGLAHLLLVRNGGNGEFTRLLLKQGERGDFCFLCVRLAIDAIPTMMDQTTNNEEKKDRM